MESIEYENYSPRQILCDLGYENAIVFENPSYDSAIIGVSSEGQVIYDYNLMIHYLINQDHMSSEEAMEFIDYNTLRSLNHINGTPIILYSLEGY